MTREEEAMLEAGAILAKRHEAFAMRHAAVMRESRASLEAAQDAAERRQAIERAHYEALGRAIEGMIRK